MDHVTYDEEGNPVVGRVVNRRRRPPQAPVSTNTAPPQPQQQATLTAIFEIEGASYDVVLDDSTISWVPVNMSSKGGKTKKSKASILKRLRGAKSQDGPNPADGVPTSSDRLPLRQLLGVRLRRVKRDAQKPGDGVCQGLELVAYDKKGANRYKDRLLLLAHPSEDVCVTWMDRIQKVLAEYTERPRSAKVFLQPHAGRKQGRSLYESKVKPLFDVAGVIDDVTEVDHNEHIKQQFVHMDPSDYDCVVVVGGDGTAHKVLNGLMNRVQAADVNEMKASMTPQRSPTPLAIIPTGYINQIAHSLQGVEDVVTAAIHVVLGHKKPVNVSALYHKDRLHRWAFTCHYGFFGNVLAYLSRYNIMGDKKVEAAIMKGLTKKKFRSYEAEIQYISAGGESSVTKGSGTGDRCTTGCSMCETDLNASHLSAYSDDVQELDPLTASSTSSTIIDKWWGTRPDPLATSCTSSIIQGSSRSTVRGFMVSDCSIIADLSKEMPWRSIKGDFIDVGVYCLPALSSFAPRGLCPQAHTNDGILELVLVRATNRREFIRFLRRQLNTKNQFSFPFVEVIRCKEINFHIRLKETWMHTDYGFNEINYEMERCEREKEKGDEKAHLKRAQSADIIEELFLEDSDDEQEEDNSKASKQTSTPSNSTSSSTQMSVLNRPATSKKKPKEKEKSKKKKQKGKSSMTSHFQPTNDDEGENAVTSFQPDTSDEDEERETSIANSVVDITNPMSANNAYVYRKTFQEMERARRKAKQMKKDEKRRTAAEAGMRSVWNLDSEVCCDLDLDFRIHPNMVCIMTEGVSPDTEYDDVSYSCLTVMK